MTFVSIDVRKGDMEGLLSSIKTLQRHIPFALKESINSWLVQTNRHMKDKVDSYLEGGAEKFTKSGFRFNKVKNKRRLYGDLHLSLRFKKSYLDRYYLKNIVFGGEVVPPRPDRKKLMQPIPGRVTLSKKTGNLTKGKYASLRKQANYFYGIPAGGPQTENRRGLWKVKKHGRKGPRGGKKKKMEMVIALGKESRMTPPLFPAPKIAARRYKRHFPIHFVREFRKAASKSWG